MKSSSKSTLILVILIFLFNQEQKKCFDDCDVDSFKLKKLPENFAETVLNLELDMEQVEVSLDAVNQLIELYAVQLLIFIIFLEELIDRVQLNIMNQSIAIDF